MVHVEKLFSKTYGFGKVKEKEEKLQYKSAISCQRNSRVTKINQSIYYYEIL